MRGFRCVPVSVKYASTLATLTSFERDVYYSALVAQDDRHCLPFETATLRSEIFPTRPFVALREITHARDKLVALGVFLRKVSPRKEWLEIAPEYRHTEGQNETSFGDETPSPSQAEFALGPVVLLPAASAAGKKSNRSREEQKQNRADPESARKAEHPTSNIQHPTPNGEESRNREQALGEEESGGAMSGPDHPFARSEEEIRATALGRKLWGFIGPKQMRLEAEQSGARWLQMIRERADDLADLIEQGQRIQASELPTGESRARFLTKRLADRDGTERRSA